jgi:diguanylate cyclase (GGDEF)-like protein
MFKRFSLTTSMLLITVVVGVVIWLGYDAYQYRALNSVLKESLSQRFHEQARVHRLRFDNYVKSFNPSVKLYAENSNLLDYLQKTDWSAQVSKVIEYDQLPPWLPEISSLRRFVLPRFAMLLDDSGKVREVYHYKNSIVPEELLNIPALVLEISKGQSYLTICGGKPYLLTSDDVVASARGKNVNASLLIASPIDERFLQDSQGTAHEEGFIALLKEGEDRIFVSNNETLIASGTMLEELKKSYLITGEGFFDSGSSDIIVRFYSLISTKEIVEQAEEILNKDRRIRAVTAITFILTFGFVMYWITSRVKKLNRKVVEFSKQMAIPQPEIINKDELVELERRFELLARAVQLETQALEHQTLHDLLTDLPNRKLWHERLSNEVSSCTAGSCAFVLMACDLNNFKEVNDTLGHHVGDTVLKQAAERLQSTLRGVDTVARLGGDEFCVLLSKTAIDAAEVIVRKIIEAFSSPFAIEGNIIKVGISVGIVEYPAHGKNVEQLMQRADAAMYHAKKNKLGFSIYDSDVQHHVETTHGSRH